MLTISGLFARKSDRKAGLDLYEHIRNQARNPVFYTDYTVSDSLDGRFDILVLHLFLVLNRFSKEEQEHPVLRCLSDRLIDDLDAALREMGVGDLSVPKKIKKFAKAALGRLEAYHASFSSDSGADFENALARNVYRTDQAPDGAAVALAAYCRSAAAFLSTQDRETVLSGSVAFPEPAPLQRPVAS